MRVRFFLHGAKLSREAILQGAGAWRLHLAVFGATFVMFPVLGLVDRGSILMVVYTALSAAVVEVIWTRLSGLDLALVVALDLAMVAAALLLTRTGARALASPSRRDHAGFCGSKKSLASGVPIAGVLFPTPWSGRSSRR